MFALAVPPSRIILRKIGCEIVNVFSNPNSKTVLSGRPLSSQSCSAAMNPPSSAGKPGGGSDDLDLFAITERRIVNGSL